MTLSRIDRGYRTGWFCHVQLTVTEVVFSFMRVPAPFFQNVQAIRIHFSVDDDWPMRSLRGSDDPF